MRNRRREKQRHPDLAPAGCRPRLPGSILAVHLQCPLADAHVEAAGEVLGDGVHAHRARVAGIALVVVPALRAGIAAGPLLDDACFLPPRDGPLETFAPHGKELGTVVEGSVPHALSRHLASDVAALVQHDYSPPGGRELTGGEEAGHASSDHDAGVRPCGVRHAVGPGSPSRRCRGWLASSTGRTPLPFRSVAALSMDRRWISTVSSILRA